MNHWKQIADIVDRHQTFLIVSHQYPDGDASGSSLGLLHYLRSLGKSARCVNGSPIQKVLQFLDPEQAHEIYDRQNFDWSSEEVVVILDTSDVKRLGIIGEDLPWDKVISVHIDHHRQSDDAMPATHRYVDPSASSVGEMITDLILSSSQTIPSNAASALYVAVMTDTGAFRFANTSGRALRTAAVLTDAGASPEKLYEQVYECNSWTRIKIFGEMLNRAERLLDGRIVYSVLPHEAFEQAKANPEEIEGFVEYLRTVDASLMSLLFREIEQKVKVSLRSRNQVNVADFASEFGGGGHKYAAGFVSNENLAEVVRETLERAQRFVTQSIGAACPCPQ